MLFSSVHLHLRLRPCINSYGEVQSDIDNGKEEEGGDEEEGLGEHGAVGIGELQLEVLDVSLCQKLSRSSGENNNCPASGVQVGKMLLIFSSGNWERSVQLEVRHPLGQDDLDLGLLDQHVVIDVIHQAHVEHMDVTLVEDVLVAGHVVADNIVGFPATKEGEPWAQVQLHCIIHHLEMTGADVADIIPVVDILGSRRQKSLEVLHAGHSTVLPLELISGKRTLQLSATVDNVNSFLDSQVTPH